MGRVEVGTFGMGCQPAAAICLTWSCVSLERDHGVGQRRDLDRFAELDFQRIEQRGVEAGGLARPIGRGRGSSCSCRRLSEWQAHRPGRVRPAPTQATAAAAGLRCLP